MKTFRLLICLWASLYLHPLHAQISETTSRPDIYHSKDLTGMWRLVNPTNDSLILLNYYKVFQADSSFFIFESDPEKGNLPTAYGYYTQCPDGTFMEHTLGNCRNNSQEFKTEINFNIQNTLWLTFKYRIKGQTHWYREYYMRVTREDPQQLYKLLSNKEI